jgi:hypothetical protein
MISTLLGKIGNLFEKDFLLGSFLPALLFLSAICIPIAVSLGLLPLFAYIETLTAAEKALSIATSGIITVTFAYLLNALRPTNTRFWCGDLGGWIFRGFVILGQFVQTARYNRINNRANESEELWKTTFETFRLQVAALWGKGTGALPDKEQEKFLRRIARLRSTEESATVLKDLAPIVQSFATYTGQSLQDVYAAVKTKLIDDWWANHHQRIQDEQQRLDRSFGKPPIIRATLLGNYIQSYNYYSYTRYAIEPEIFWHRLEPLMKKEDLESVDNQRTLLDFALTMATLSVAYLVFAVFAGPWIWSATPLWIVLAVISVGSGYFFYNMGVIVAYDLGDRIRASFDLNRLKMMKALGRSMPATFYDEKKQWEELSRLAVYGTTESDFDVSLPS